MSRELLERGEIGVAEQLLQRFGKRLVRIRGVLVATTPQGEPTGRSDGGGRLDAQPGLAHSRIAFDQDDLSLARRGPRPGRPDRRQLRAATDEVGARYGARPRRCGG